MNMQKLELTSKIYLLFLTPEFLRAAACILLKCKMLHKCELRSAATVFNYTPFSKKNKIVLKRSTKKWTKDFFNYSLLEEKESVMGFEPEGEFLPSIWLKSWNNLVPGHRIYKTDGAR